MERVLGLKIICRRTTQSQDTETAQSDTNSCVCVYTALQIKGEEGRDRRRTQQPGDEFSSNQIITEEISSSFIDRLLETDSPANERGTEEECPFRRGGGGGGGAAGVRVGGGGGFPRAGGSEEREGLPCVL